MSNQNFGIRETCDVLFRAKADNTKIGSKVFMKDEPVLMFSSVKTSSLDGTAVPVYAQGGRGNPRLITWEGEKEMNFTFEEALISEQGLAILMGAELSTGEDQYFGLMVRARAATVDAAVKIDINDEVHELGGAEAILCDGTGSSENDKAAKFAIYETDESGSYYGQKITDATVTANVISGSTLVAGKYYYVDGYVKTAGSSLEITPDKFSDYFYIEGKTVVRQEADGKDRVAEIIIPKGKISSQFNISFSNTGDPSTFSFNVAAMADYTKFNKRKKVLCAINIIGG